MTKCRYFRKMFIEILHEKTALEVRKALEDHMTSCPKCASEFESLSRTLGIMDRHDVPDPGPDYWDGYWDRLERRLNQEGPAPASLPVRRLHRGSWGSIPKWAWTAASAVILLAAGAVVDRFLLDRPAPPVSTAASRENAPPIVDVAYDELINGASHYLDRSKVLLIAMVNRQAADDPAALDFTRQKRISSQLITEAAALKRGLERNEGPDNKRLARLIADLEVILLQIANLEAESDPAAINIIKSGVQDRGLIFQINLSQLRLDKASSGRERSLGSVLPEKKSSI